MTSVQPVMKSDLAFDFQQYCADRRALIEKELGRLVADTDPDSLWDAMRYSLLSGGKRIRALLCLASAEAVAGEDGIARALPCACAIEMIHAMSLIHDDLPCMDNDDYRRGRLTNHKVYGEAMALLAGDALLALAQQVVLTGHSTTAPSSISNDLAYRTILVAAELARASGPKGMVGGQVMDMAATGAGAADSAGLRSIHARKTGALLAFSTWSGACLAGADENILSCFQSFGEILGLAFQIADDLLDVTGDMATLGKTPGKDEAAGKLTWVSVYGVENSRNELKRLADEGQMLLASAGLKNANPLTALLSYAVERTH